MISTFEYFTVYTYLYLCDIRVYYIWGFRGTSYETINKLIFFKNKLKQAIERIIYLLYQKIEEKYVCSGNEDTNAVIR